MLLRSSNYGVTKISTRYYFSSNMYRAVYYNPVVLYFPFLLHIICDYYIFCCSMFHLSIQISFPPNQTLLKYLKMVISYFPPPTPGQGSLSVYNSTKTTALNSTVNLCDVTYLLCLYKKSKYKRK